MEEDSEPGRGLGRQEGETGWQSSDELLRGVMDVTPDAVYVKGLQGHYLMMNRAGAARWGLKPEEVVGRDDFELFGRVEALRQREEDRQVMDDGQPRTFLDTVTLRGRARPWCTTKGPYRHPGGQVVGVFGISRDMTEVLQQTDDPGQRIRELEADLLARDSFLAVASHELKSPLGALRLQLESTLRQLRTDPAASRPEALSRLMERLELSEQQVDQLARHVSNLMDVTGVTLGKVALRLDEVDLGSLVKEVVQRLAPDLTRAGGGLELRLASGVVGRWDRCRLEQILTNLVSNALKYGEGKPVTVTVEARGSTAVVEVRDRGIGIPREEQARIFGRFERTPGARPFPGMGLGLWVVKVLVDAHKGQVRLRSEPGQGSTFTVELPLEA